MSFSPADKVKIPPFRLIVIGNNSDAVAKLGDSRIEQFLDLKNIESKAKKTYGQQLH